MERRLRSRLALFPLILLVVVAVTYAYCLLSSVTRISSVGIVKAVGVGVYWDVDCTSTVTEIDWGLLEPRGTANVTIYLKNEGNAPLTLSLNTENWDPPNASDHITINWSYRGESVNPGQLREVALVLSVSSTITGITNFRFAIIITGSG